MDAEGQRRVAEPESASGGTMSDGWVVFIALAAALVGLLLGTVFGFALGAVARGAYREPDEGPRGLDLTKFDKVSRN